MTDKNRLYFLSGRKCRYFSKGRCLYEEYLNQGLYPQKECRVLKQWELQFDAFVHRAEQFGLDEQTAGKMWQSRMEELLLLERNCSQFSRSADDSLMDCIHAEQHLCLLTFPTCQGRCRHFTLSRSSA